MMPSRWRRALWLAAVLAAGVGRSDAHIGAPDVYVKAQAGPYALLVSVHPPAATPGAAGVDVRTEDAGVSAISVALPGGAGQVLQRFSTEQIFTGSVWVASGGAWRVVIHVSGMQGEAETSVPIPAMAAGGSRLPWVVGAGAVVLLGFAVFRRQRRVGMAAAALSAVVVAMVLFGVRKPVGQPQMQVTLGADGRLELRLPGASQGKMDDLVEDHGYLMHFFAVRQPQLDVLLHLHPQQTAPGVFTVQLPSMAPGGFALYADVVHRDGRLETYTASAGLPVQVGHVLQGDDAVGVVPGIARTQAVTGPGRTTISLMDGYGMRMELAAALHPKTGQMLRFTLLDAAGNPPADMQLYMGMAAHAVVLKTDGTVFAHIHPAGTIPMAAYGRNMAGMEMGSAATNEVSFPFGFPTAGRYRVFVEMKHGGVIETGAFDLQVE